MYCLNQFLLYTVGVFWERNLSNINKYAEILLLVRHEIILTLNINTVEEHEGKTIIVYTGLFKMSVGVLTTFHTIHLR